MKLSPGKASAPEQQVLFVFIDPIENVPVPIVSGSDQLEVVRALGFDADFHYTASLGKFDGVGQKVVEDLFELLLVERDFLEF